MKAQLGHVNRVSPTTRPGSGPVRPSEIKQRVNHLRASTCPGFT
jgi:hypothetical protein